MINETALVHFDLLKLKRTVYEENRYAECVGTVVGRINHHPCPKETIPCLQVKFGKGIVLNGVYDISGDTFCVPINDRSYGVWVDSSEKQEGSAWKR